MTATSAAGAGADGWAPSIVADPPPSDVTVPPAVVAEEPGKLADLSHLLAVSTSGLAFIYEALELVVARFGLRDAVVVLDDTPIGRQVFRAGRRPIGRLRSRSRDRHAGGAWARTMLTAASGVHVDPPVLDGSTAAYIQSLVMVALRLDMLHHDATHDPLTGLLNRRSYELMLRQAVARTERYGWPFALVLLDLDDFKRINDRLGHAAGDAALRSLGGALRQSLRGGDVAARIGGDEFALLIANGTETVLAPLTRRLEGALNRAVPGGGLRFSAGMSCYPSDAENVEELCRLADQRLYAAKPVVR
ncbi:MAG TPA: GGDEF domain-containing protein [Acidimicrobiales bacterium]